MADGLKLRDDWMVRFDPPQMGCPQNAEGTHAYSIALGDWLGVVMPAKDYATVELAGRRFEVRLSPDGIRSVNEIERPEDFSDPFEMGEPEPPHVFEIRDRLDMDGFCGCNYCIDWLKSACRHLLATIDGGK